MMGREHLYNLAALPGAMVVAVADPHPGSCEATLAATAGLQSVVPSPPLTVRPNSTHSSSSPSSFLTQVLMRSLKLLISQYSLYWQFTHSQLHYLSGTKLQFMSTLAIASNMSNMYILDNRTSLECIRGVD